MGEDDARERLYSKVKVIVVIGVGKTGREARNGRSQASNQSITHETHEAGWMRVEVVFFLFFCVIFGVKEEKANRRRTMEVRETRDGRNNQRK